MSNDVVIAGGGFGGLAMMPGIARKLRLGLDWGVGLLFGRAADELGQLGQPEPLAWHLEDSEP